MMGMDLEESILIALRKVIRATDQYSKKLEKQSGLTTAQLLLLQAIQQDGPATVGQLADAISVSAATATSILDRLEKRGVVRRQRSLNDRRKVLVQLTEEGHTRLAEAPPALQQRFVQQYQQLEDWEQALLLSAMQRVAHMMGADAIDASPVLDLGTIDRASTGS